MQAQKKTAMDNDLGIKDMFFSNHSSKQCSVQREMPKYNEFSKDLDPNEVRFLIQ